MQYKRTPAQKRLHNWLVCSGCVICGAPAELHHVIGASCKQKYMMQTLVIGQWFCNPLCYDHHRNPNVINVTSRKKEFIKTYGNEYLLHLNKVDEYYREKGELPYPAIYLRAIAFRERQEQEADKWLTENQLR